MNFEDKKILVIGDAILDEYVEGLVTRISPEAPIPILNKTNTYYRLGGCLNVAKNLTSLGSKVWVISRIGGGSAGNIIRKLLDESKINIDLLITEDNIPTTVKTRFVSNQHQLLRVDEEDCTSFEYHKNILNILHNDLDRHLRYFDGVIISDYNKGVVFPKLITQLGELNLKYNKVLVADTKKEDITLFKNYTCLTPNVSEFKKLLRLNDNPKTEERINQILFGQRIKNLLVTKSEEGMVLFHPDLNTTTHLPAEQKNITDVSGCGDTVTAIYTLCLTCGLPPYMCAKLANKGAGIVATKFGTATITHKELFNA